ncbi:hypothetical protein D3836_00365 [Streptococcus mutans]|nr:hypothetical protein [Streptococcus mutans]NLQ60337.1 hypothetical protein [Streptococcus mutans]
MFIFLQSSVARVQLEFDPKVSNLPSSRNVDVSATFITEKSLV